MEVRLIFEKSQSAACHYLCRTEVLLPTPRKSGALLSTAVCARISRARERGNFPVQRMDLRSMGKSAKELRVQGLDVGLDVAL